MDYGQIISQSWDLLWKKKILLVFGFLAALSGGGFNVNGNFGQTTSFPENFPQDFPGQDIAMSETRAQIEHLIRLIEGGNISEAIDTLSAIIGFPAIFLIGLACLLIALSIVLWLVSLTARASLIAAVEVDYDGEARSWRQLFAIGLDKLWQLVGLKLILFGIPVLLFLFFFIVSFAPIFLSMMRGATTGQIQAPSALMATFPLLMCGFICIGIPLMFAVTITDGYAFRGIVMDNMKIFESIRHGWRVGMDNLGPTIILGIIFAVISIAVGALVLIPVGIFTLGYGDLGSDSYIISAILFLGSMLIMAAFNSLFVTLQSIVFSKAYLEFTYRKPVQLDIEASVSI